MRVQHYSKKEHKSHVEPYYEILQGKKKKYK
jgi:hypothetical protein